MTDGFSFKEVAWRQLFLSVCFPAERLLRSVRLDAGGGKEGVRGVHSSSACLVLTHEGVRGRLMVPRAALFVGRL